MIVKKLKYCWKLIKSQIPSFLVGKIFSLIGFVNLSFVFLNNLLFVKMKIMYLWIGTDLKLILWRFFYKVDTWYLVNFWPIIWSISNGIHVYNKVQLLPHLVSTTTNKSNILLRTLYPHYYWVNLIVYVIFYFCG